MKSLFSLVALFAFAGSSLADDALAVVNAQRAQRGLRPFLPDAGLAAGAQKCAEFRAANLMFDHTSNDFAFLPPGVSASAAGCAAYPTSYGFMACCTYENYVYAGAASVMGRDGRVFHHLFVSNTPSTVAVGVDAPPSPVIPAPMATPAAPAAACAAPPTQYQVQHRGLFGRRSVLVPVTQGACAPAQFAPAPVTVSQSAFVGGCANGSCSLPGRTTVRSHLTIRQR